MKKIWIVNHYATNMYFDKGGRHYEFAKFLDKNKYDVTIVCSNRSYISDQMIEMTGVYKKIEDTDFDWIFVETSPFKGNGLKRIYNMYEFYKKLFHVIKSEKIPDIILGSNVHLLTCLFSVKMKKKYKVKSIVEMRDLWPECFIGGRLGKIKPLMSLLYSFEKYLYRETDAIIGTMEGIKDYIETRHTKLIIDNNKIFYINNGVDIDKFNINTDKFIPAFDQAEYRNKIKIVYTGTINLANGIENIIKLSKLLKKYTNDVQFIIYGSGNYQENLIKRIDEEKIENICLKGRISKNMIPSVLSNADFLLLNYGNQSMFRWGESQNKLFEYMASGKPILSNVKTDYDIVKKFDIGAFYDVEDEETIIALHNYIHMNKQQYDSISQRELLTTNQFDFKVLTKQLEEVLLYVMDKK